MEPARLRAQRSAIVDPTTFSADVPWTENNHGRERPQHVSEKPRLRNPSSPRHGWRKALNGGRPPGAEAPESEDLGSTRNPVFQPRDGHSGTATATPSLRRFTKPGRSHKGTWPDPRQRPPRTGDEAFADDRFRVPGPKPRPASPTVRPRPCRRARRRFGFGAAISGDGGNPRRACPNRTGNRRFDASAYTWHSE